jgi:hypothetical protein
VSRPQPSVYAWLQSQPRGAILELPFLDDTWTFWAAHHQLPIVNGIGAFEPERYQVLWQLMKRDFAETSGDLEGSRSLAYLKAWFPIRYVLVHEAAPRAMREAVAATTSSLELVHESAEGDCVYRLHRRGAGVLLRRAFREDQLRQGRIRVRVAGPEGALLRLRFNGDAATPPLVTVAFGRGPEDHEARIPARTVRRGLNLLELSTEGGQVFELLEVEGIGLDSGRTE